MFEEPTFPEIPNTTAPNYFEEDIKPTTNSVVARYENELNEIDDVLDMFEKKINELKMRKVICSEVLAAIKEFDAIK